MSCAVEGGDETLTSHTKSKLKILIMVRQVVFLHFFQVYREPGMV